MAKRHVRFQIIVPKISDESISKAKKIATAHAPGCDEHFIASALLMLADELETLNDDLARAGSRFWRKKLDGEP